MFELLAFRTLRFLLGFWIVDFLLGLQVLKLRGYSVIL